MLFEHAETFLHRFLLERSSSCRIENSSTRSIRTDERRSQRDKSRFMASNSFLTKDPKRPGRRGEGQRAERERARGSKVEGSRS